MLTSDSPVQAYLEDLHTRLAQDDSGAVADYIPELALADRSSFGIALATVDGAIYEVGDTRLPFTIQSISKPLTFAMALESSGETVRERVGVEPTGEPFNAIDLDPLNPLVNAGAILTRSLLGAEPDPSLLEGYSAFAGRELAIDDRVRQSESHTAYRNRAIAHLLRGAGRFDGDPDEIVENYIAQCSVLVDCRDLAVIAATLAAGGRNPVTGQTVVSPDTVRDVLSVMATAGMYDAAGDWLYDVGLPAKSGVAGGVIAVLPGRLGIGVFSPPLDDRGNSVRGVRVCEELSRSLDLHIFKHSHGAPSPVRRTFTLAELTSKREREPAVAAQIAREGARARAFELQGDLGFAEAEQVTRAVLDAPAELVVLDLRRVSDVHAAAVPLLAGLGDRISALSAAPGELTQAMSAQPFDELDRALEFFENRLTGDTAAPALTSLDDHAVLRGISPNDLAQLEGLLEHRFFAAGDYLVRSGDSVSELLLITSGVVSETVAVPGGGVRRIATLGAGMTIGELALLTGVPRVGDARADTEVECHALPADALAGLRQLDANLRAVLLRNLLEIVAARSTRTRQDLATLVD
ncbi:MAG TPA: glutaminase A [Solirubrobacteraceae bacterium]